MKNLVKTSNVTNNGIANFQNLEIKREGLKALKGGSIVVEEVAAG